MNIIDYEENKIEDLYLTMKCLLKSLETAHLKLSNESFNILIDKLRLLNTDINNMQSNINNILLDLKNNNLVIDNELNDQLIEEEKTNKFLKNISPLLLLYSINNNY